MSAGLKKHRRRCRNCRKWFYSLTVRYCSRKCHQAKITARQKQASKLKYTAAATSLRLRSNPPKSDKWFQEEWSRIDMIHEADQYNVPLGVFIPDCLNVKYKYVIEVDGDIHLRSRQRRRDAQKDRYYKQKGYSVFRVKAFDMDHLRETADLIDRLRNSSGVNA